MNFGSTVVILREKQGIFQTDLDSRLNIHKNVLGRYKRNEVLPSIEITRKRILEVSKFEEQDKLHIFSVIDAFIAKRKIQSIL